jgi:4-hydroxy-tetrahydrodipicolinate reductase
VEQVMAEITVLVSGAAGRMGQEVVRAIKGETDLRLVGAVDVTRVGEDIGTVCGLGVNGIKIGSDLAAALTETAPQVMVDFSLPAVVKRNIVTALEAHVACVVGATGLKEDDLDELCVLSSQHDHPVFVAPNFAIGAVLMMEFAAQAARYFPKAEIIELHHDKKLDSPSGTALLTARKMVEVPGSALQAEINAAEAPRGQLFADRVCMHSVRLPGLVAHQEVIFGGLGQTLTIRHDSLNRESFMPGVILAIRKVQGLQGLVVGLEKIM